MAGSNDSGQDMEAGRTNRASNRTRIWMSSRTDGEVGFEGPAILIVEPQLEPREDDEDLPIEGTTHVTGIMATGWSEGTGLLGTGGSVRGIGVHGQGGGSKDRIGTGVLGVGTFGVHGIGISTQSKAAPGAGLVATGGRRNPDDEQRLLHGAGVIAIAGGTDQPIPGFEATGSVGVYAQGGDSQTTAVSRDQTTVISGQPRPGPGLLGRGGATSSRVDRQSPATGVVGLAGGVEIPADGGMSDCGVFGLGPTGVLGQSIAGIGCRGASTEGRGAQFSSEKAAQLNLRPNARIKSARDVADGQAGDLLALTEGGIASLWFCKRSSTSRGGAEWVQLA